MKINRTFSIDLDLWLEFKRKSENYSDTITNLIRSYCSISKDLEQTEISKLKAEINDKIVLIAKLTEEQEKAKKEAKKETKTNYQKTKWEKIEEAAQQLRANNWDYSKVERG